VRVPPEEVLQLETRVKRVRSGAEACASFASRAIARIPSSIHMSDHSLLLSASSYVELELARNLLDQAGIPCFVDGHPFNALEDPGRQWSGTRRDLFVPRSKLDRARELLKSAWGERFRD